MRCGGCGHAMSGVNAGNKGERRPYYWCHHRARHGAEVCPNKKHHRAEKIEAEAWETLSGLLKYPERLEIGIERMIEEKRATLRQDPTHELRHWHGELEKIERMRSGYLDQQAEGIISMSELKGKLASLDERRTVAERELKKLTHHQEQIYELEREAEALKALYGHQATEGLDLYTPQDKHDAYKSLVTNVIAYPDGTAELTGSMLLDVDSDSIRSIGLPCHYIPSAPEGEKRSRTSLRLT